jgi:hypothetical protein
MRPRVVRRAAEYHLLWRGIYHSTIDLIMKVGRLLRILLLLLGKRRGGG